MGKNGKRRVFLGGATVEKASTYVFAGHLIRIAALMPERNLMFKLKSLLRPCIAGAISGLERLSPMLKETEHFCLS